MEARTHYRLFEHGTLLGTFTPKEITSITGCPNNAIFAKARKGERWQKKYTFERVTDGELIDPESFREDFAKLWNERRISVFRRAGKDVYVCDRCSRIIEGNHMQIPGYGTSPCRHLHYACFKRMCEERERRNGKTDGKS